MRVLLDKAIRVETRDGEQLATDVYRPDVREQLPALVQRVPYGRDVARIVDFSLAVQRALEAGYVVVVQDVRGRGASSGAFTPFLDDRNDGADTIAWAARQPWCNGRVGLFGGSYGGATQWAAARERPPALAALAPFVATPDCYDGWIYRTGVFELGFNLHWTLRNIAPGEAARSGNGTREAVIAANDETEALYERLPVADQPVLAGVTDYYREWAAEPEPTGRWGGLVPGDPVGVPVLSIGGWYDVFQRGSLRGYELGPSGRRRLVMGPWAHGVFGGTFVDQAYGIRADSALVDLTSMQLRWFDRWLKDEANDVEHDSPVSVFVLGANTWRDERDWPPPDVEFVDYFFHSHGHANTLDGDGMLTAQPPTAEPADMLRYDPNTPVPTWGGATFLPGLHLAANAGPRDQRTIEQREDVLCFTSEPLDEPLLVIGPVEAFVYVSSPAPDLDLTATLVDVEPDGRAINVTDGIARARYRDSRASPTLLRPGTTYELRIDLGGAACLFRRGHRIRVDISGGSFPRYDRNPQTGEAPGHAVRLQAATHTIHHDAAHASRIVLPVVPLGDA